MVLSVLSLFDLLFLDSASYTGSAGHRDVVDEFYRTNKEDQKLFPRLDENDGSKVIKVWYLEHILAAWVLERSPWNAYHSGIGFSVQDKASKQQWFYAADYFPRLTGEIAPILHPTLIPRYPRWMPHLLGVAYSYVFATFELLWENEGSLRFYASETAFPGKFTNLTYVGEISPRQFNHIREWFFRYQEEHLTFEPVQIVVNDTVEFGLPSTMCHDLFYHALYELHEIGFQPKPRDWILRDHVFVFAKNYEKVKELDWRTRREITRFYWFYIMFMSVINDNFANVRDMFASSQLEDVPAFFYFNKTYYRMELVNPWINYCYLPVNMPPDRATLVKDEHRCALTEIVPKEEVRSSLSLLSAMVYRIDTMLDNEVLLASVVALFTHLLVTSRVF